MSPVLAQAAATVAMPTAWFWPAVFSLLVALIAFFLKDMLDRIRADIRAGNDTARENFALVRKDMNDGFLRTDGEIKILRERSHEHARVAQSLVAKFDMLERRRKNE